MAINKIKTGSIQDGTVTTDDIQDGAITNAKVNACAAIVQSKVTGLATSISNLCSSISSVSSSIGQQANNIGLLGFKMAVNDGLTVFNLVDGVVDEFHDESGTDEAEGSNDYYCGTTDFYQNITFTPACFSAGFSTTAITEPDTSVAGTNPVQSRGTYGSFTVPTAMTSLSVKAWGSGGSGASTPTCGNGGGGGFSTGTFAVTPGQTLTVVVGEGGASPGTYSPCIPGPSHNGAGFGGYRPAPAIAPFGNQQTVTGGGGARNTPGSNGYTSGGGGLSGLFTGCLSGGAPTAVVIAGAGGGSELSGTPNNNQGGAAGGATGYAGGGYPQSAQTSNNSNSGGGGSQSVGGTGAPGSPNGGSGPFAGTPGGLFYGGNNAGGVEVNQTFGAGGGAGYYGGGGGAWVGGRHGSGGGGSGYAGHPQVTSPSVSSGAAGSLEGGGVGDPQYVPGTNDGGPSSPRQPGQDGYVLLTGAGCVSSTASTTITSEPFASGTVATNSRIVVFEENVETPTLNTDIIASVSRDAGVTFTTATLSDSGYVTGSSGQRILTGQADISGQPSGQSMRWKLALANNQVKIHGVSLQWS